MLIVFDSLTGNVDRFVGKLSLPSQRITKGLVVKTDYILITYTTGLGKVPETTAGFLKDNSAYLRGVASSGNRNFGSNFARAADEIAEKYKVPLLLKFEFFGVPSDITRLMEEINHELYRTE